MWNPEVETMSRPAVEELQRRRLQDVVSRAYDNVAFYRRRMEAKGVTPRDIRSPADLSKLPFTTKQDMRNTYPYGLLAVPVKNIRRFHSSSGTTGKPTAVAYTDSDLAVWAEVLARTLSAGGLKRGSVFQVAVNYGLFTGGLGMHYAAEKVGASVIPASSGNTARQIMLMQDFGTTAMVSTPSYALHLAEAMETMGVRPQDLALSSIFCGAEAWSDGMRREIEASFGVKAYDVYGLSEIIGPGVSCDCHVQDGLHIQEDHFYPEVIDPETGEILPDGEIGELVLTTLTKEGMPMLRYRTRDLTALDRTPCPCGRTQIRMKRVVGRSDDMLIIRGVNIFPSQVESVLLGMGTTAPHYQLIVDREGNLDTLTVMVEMTGDLAGSLNGSADKLEKKIQGELKSVLGLKAVVRLVEPRTIARSEGKAKRVIDKRVI
ncbi:MAG TPA: phenylacetate--CoA ligase [Methylomusa anaerophila]|uniref:Phenylacetate-coenzyme A ligase n=1 Tax=Methylomusa anaerophila TaxID=1930071 RepID=A0A348ALK8_9FIRM|nr:phenylacetate--CoA ligase [Methylomusa anaerophila]BBB91956.1 phenylacetate-coenzyme A ligase [Methylomusa anaerophila]HML88032.1 phenylacetate--CoA ligase [Methylomusa anaerophila]